MRIITISFITLIFTAASAFAEHPKPPLEAYGGMPRVSDAEISPDGTKVATIVNMEDDTRIVVFSLVGDEPIQFGVEKIKARSVAFYDNDHVIFRASQTTKTYGFRGEYEFTGAFVMDLETLELDQLLGGTRNLFPAQSGLGKIIGRGENAGEVLMPAYTGGRGSDPSFDLLRVKLESPRGRRFVRGSNDTIDWFVGDKGNVLARERYDNGRNLYRVEAYQNKKWKTIHKIEDSILPMSIWGGMPDESGLVFVRVQNDGYDALMKLGLDGEVTGPILPPKDREIESIYTDNNRKILGIRYAGVEPDYAFLDDRLRESYESVSESLPEATIFLDSWTDDHDKVLYHVFEASIGDVWLSHTVSTNKLAIVANRRPDIPTAALGPIYNIEYKARDELTIGAILTAPPDYVPGDSPPQPTIVLPHGGPASYDMFSFDWMAQFFANRGYVVFQPNFRGSTGFGDAFEYAGRGEWGAKMQDDITDGLNALVTAGYADPDRVCIVGASYGGYAALAGAVFTPELYQCVIAIAPVSDLNRMLTDEKRDHGRDHWVVSYWEDIMAEGDARRKKLRAISPVHFADQVQAPVLLLHGDDDTVVPYKQSTRMRSALRDADKQVELVKLKGEDHWLSVADTRIQTLKEMDRFIAEHLPVE